MVIESPIMVAWIANNLNVTEQGDDENNNNNNTIQVPILDEGGLYDLQVDIFSIDNDTNTFKAINSLTFNSGLCVGEIITHDVDYFETRSNVTIISYYDRIQNFSFSSKYGSITCEMPF
ncbi:MAG: hypothetical protein ACRD8Z_17185 [Nitrososphaeraceae archaeon]